MTDRQDSDSYPAQEPTPFPAPDTTAPQATYPAGQHDEPTPAPLGDAAAGGDPDPFGARPGTGAAPIPGYGAPSGGGEETTAGVPARGEGTGPTVALDPEPTTRNPELTTRLPPMPPRPRAPYDQPPRQHRGPAENAPGPGPGGAPRQWGQAPPPPPGQWGTAAPPPGPRRDGPPPPGRPGPPQPQRPGPWGESAGHQQPAAGWGEPGYPGGAPSNYNYVDAIRSSDLVPVRKQPPRRGWRKALMTASFGLINLGRSPDERYQDDLEAKTRTLLRGRYKIGVLGKGGTGKTTLAASLGSIFAELRQDDRVVAIDADTAFGKLASRIDPHTAGSYWELAVDQHLYSFADVRSRVGSNAAGLFVLAGEHNIARRRVLDPAIYREATARLDNHFTISIVDCGSTMDSAVTQEALADLDALLVVSSPWVDGASAAGQTMDWLAAHGFTGLLHRTVVVINDSDGHADKRMLKVLAEQFGGHGQVVVQVPYDPHLRPGGVIDVDNQISRTTRRRLLEIAASIAEHFAATTDGHRERR